MCRLNCKCISIFCLTVYICGYFIWASLITTDKVCKISAILNRECYEKDGNYYFNQFVKINGFSDNDKAYIECGKVLNCDTSACNFKYYFGEDYYCSLSKSNLYLLDDTANIFIRYSFYILCICIVILMWLCVDSIREIVSLYVHKSNKSIDESSVLLNVLSVNA